MEMRSEKHSAAVITFTQHGCEIAKRTMAYLKSLGYETEGYVKSKYADEAATAGLSMVEGSLRELTGILFAKADLLVFIGATGIAVRSIAPHVTSKLTDPAVICIDEQGKFVISLLSGHVGGANEAAAGIAAELEAVPVITTATDLHGKFAVDSFAVSHGLHFAEKVLAKEVSAAIVHGQKIPICSDYPVAGNLPEELILTDPDKDDLSEYPLGICITSDLSKKPFAQTLHLMPKNLHVGIGCKRDTEKEKIKEALDASFADAGLSEKCIRRIASIDLKKDEQGLIGLAADLKVPFVTYTSDELSEVSYGGQQAESDFVKSITGVGNVCERSAVRSSGAAKLLVPKRAGNGVTISVAAEKYTVRF